MFYSIAYSSKLWMEIKWFKSSWGSVFNINQIYWIFQTIRNKMTTNSFWYRLICLCDVTHKSVYFRFRLIHWGLTHLTELHNVLFNSLFIHTLDGNYMDNSFWWSFLIFNKYIEFSNNWKKCAQIHADIFYHVSFCNIFQFLENSSEFSSYQAKSP